MDLLDAALGKLVKLTIQAYEDDKREKPIDGKMFEAMFNPASYSMTHSIPWKDDLTLNGTAGKQTYTGSHSNELKLELTLDGTNVNEMGLFLFTKQLTVKERVDHFFDVTLHYVGTIHEPYYLKASWGDSLSFDCRLLSVTVTYTLFDAGGSPLRAQLSVTLVADTYSELAAKQKNAQSPDVTHARIVRSGDTLPLLTKDVYGSPARYLDVARFNGLDDFRSLTPGREILFPPLAAFGGASASKSKARK